MGSWVIMKRPDGTDKIELVRLPRTWKRVAEKRWKLTRDPASNVAVWVDQDGEVLFDQPEKDQIMTFEERYLPPPGIDPGRGHQLPSMQRFHLGIDEADLKMVVPEEDQVMEAQEAEDPGDRKELGKLPKMNATMKLMFMRPWT